MAAVAIPTRLLVDRSELIEGLLSGRYTRWGGVVRVSRGQEGAGQVVRHLLESPGLSRALMSVPGSPLLAAGQAVNSVQLGVLQRSVNVVQQTTLQALKMSQVAAGASVLNLGVSAVGFAYMGYKLHKLQNAVGELAETVDAGFADVQLSLERQSEQLSYLRLLAHQGAEERQQILEAVSEVQRALLVQQHADLAAELEHVDRFPGESRLQALKTAARTRRVFREQAARQPVEFRGRFLVVLDVAVKGWAVASASEAQLLMREGKTREASQLLEEEGGALRALSGRWASSLVDSVADEDLRQPQRFRVDELLPSISAERAERVARLLPDWGGRTEDQEEDFRVEAQLERSLDRHDQDRERWQHEQIAQADFLDGLSELSDRLETVGELAGYCERTGRHIDDLLPRDVAREGFYELEPDEE